MILRRSKRREEPDLIRSLDLRSEDVKRALREPCGMLWDWPRVPEVAKLPRGVITYINLPSTTLGEGDSITFTIAMPRQW